MTDDDFIDDMRARINPAYADQRGTESWERKRAIAIVEKWQDKHAALEEAYQKQRETAAAMISHRDEIINGLRARITYAPAAILDTRDVLGICAPTEEDFPALYAIQGRRVQLVLDDETQNAGGQATAACGGSPAP